MKKSRTLNAEEKERLEQLLSRKEKYNEGCARRMRKLRTKRKQEARQRKLRSNVNEAKPPETRGRIDA